MCCYSLFIVITITVARVARAALLALAANVMGVLFVFIVMAAAVRVAVALSVASMSVTVAVTTVSFEHLCYSLGTILDHTLKSLDTIYKGVVLDSDSAALGGKSDHCDDEGGEEAHYCKIYLGSVF